MKMVFFTGASTINTLYKIEMPAGIKVYKGAVGNQGEIYQGGLSKEQVYIPEPWKLGDSVKVIESSSLK